MGWFDFIGSFFTDVLDDYIGEVAGAVVGEVIEGAVVGAITGAAYAAITGEDIGDAALNGAIIGGITYGVIEGYDQWKNYTPDATVDINKNNPTPEVVAEPDTQKAIEDNAAFPTERSVEGDTTGNAILKSSQPQLTDAKKAVTDVVDSATSTSSLEKALTDLTKEVKDGKKFDWGTVIGQGVSGAATIYSSGKSDEAAAESAKELLAYEAELHAAEVAANQPAPSTNYKLPSFGLESPEDYLNTFAAKLDAYKGILA